MLGTTCNENLLLLTRRTTSSPVDVCGDIQPLSIPKSVSVTEERIYFPSFVKLLSCSLSDHSDSAHIFLFPPTTMTSALGSNG